MNSHVKIKLTDIAMAGTDVGEGEPARNVTLGVVK
jgi:hypothetical protein